MLLNLKELVSKYNLKIKGVIHVGAHYGEEQDVYLALGIQHKIYFEADPVNFHQMERRMKPDYHWLVNLALGSDNKTTVMFCSKQNEGQSNSLYKPSDSELKRYGFVYDEKREVKMIRLDDLKQFHPDKSCENMNFLNVDVEGFELEVFKGAVKTLKHIDYIVCEVSSDQRYEGQATEQEITEFLHQQGFEAVEDNWGGINWGDRLYCKPGTYTGKKILPDWIQLKKAEKVDAGMKSEEKPDKSGSPAASEPVGPGNTVPEKKKRGPKPKK